ncbi:uncharacterized protein LOC117179351 [Belonocnema kinseyi]|uniref:uncharacterized protein LOC117179351 n=1 Tax=Belonocnema kinseyi TaxID=2817044 RepID=UPI00143D126F|nr:uncharacterized protein LOC117179351 [Belonocnema kinseyi]
MKPSSQVTIALSKFTTVFQAKIAAITACLEEVRKRGYINHHVYICSDSQAALRALQSEEFTSRLIWSCLEELLEVSGKNWVKLIWVSGHKNIEGKERADMLAKKGTTKILNGP